MKKTSFELAILVNGKQVKEYGHDGKTFVEGRAGTEYSILIKNNSASRVLAIPSVDGLSALDGERASSDSQGYIIPAYSSYVIDGWRTSLDEVAKFEFSSKKFSYSNKTGHKTLDCGVIGLLVYSEKVSDWIYKSTPWKITEPIWVETPEYVQKPIYPWWNHNIICDGGNQLKQSYSFNCQSTGAVDLNASCLIPTETKSTEEYNLGTKFGETQQSRVSNAQFSKGDCLAALELFYSDKKGLLAMGVDLSKTALVAKVDKTPKAFSNFCKKP